MKKFLLPLLIALAIPATASAHIYVLSHSNTTNGSTGFACGHFPPCPTLHPHVPSEGGSLAFEGPTPAAFFQSTVAWNSSNGDVLVGCRGHGTATVRVWLQVNAQAHHGSTTCSGHQPWRIVLRHVSWKAHVNDATLVRTARRR